MSDLSDFFPGGGGEGGGGLTWSLRSTDFTAADGEGYMVDTATNGEVTVTLPTSPALNQQVGLKDHMNNFHDKNLLIDPGSENIEGMAGIMRVSTRGWGGELIYSETTKGWLLAYNTPMDPETKDTPRVFHARHGASGTGGGTANVGDNIRPWTHEILNTIDGASLLNDIITLPPGSYQIECEALGFEVGTSRLQIKDSPGNTTLASGIHGSFGSSISKAVTINHILDFTVETAIWINHQCANYVANVGFGWDTGWGYNVFASILITQLEAY